MEETNLAPIELSRGELLSSADRRALKARAHGLAPVAMIGASGLTPNVVAEIERCLAAHELIKIRAFSDDRGERDAWMAELCRQTGAQAVQHIGKVLVIYREQAMDAPPEPVSPPASKARRVKKVAPPRKGYAVLSHTGRPPRPGKSPRKKPRVR